MRRPPLRALLPAVAAALALLAGCSGPASDDAPEPTATATTAASPDATPTTPAAEVELDVLYPAPADAARELPEGLATLTSEEGHELTLVGVHRLTEDRVVVTGLLGLNPDVGQDFVINAWEESTHRQARAGGSEFAPFTLTVDGDDATYLPVRDDDDRCLCSVIRSGFQDKSGAMAVMTVVSAPADADTVDLTVEGFGVVPDVAVTAVPERAGTPWGARETLTVRSAERRDGAVTLRITVASPDEETGWGLGTYGSTTEQLCLAGVAVVGTGSHAGLVEGCVRGILPTAGQAKDLEIRMPDPGTPDLVVLPANGWPMVVPVEGTASEGGGEQLVAYEARSRTEGATVATGEELEVFLDTSVLFPNLESTLTVDAERTLAVAADVLRAQDGRRVRIAGHTDSVGEDDFNLQLSRDRAEAVRAALADALGEGWTFEVTGHGEEQLLAPEKGSEAEQEAARARNRRVEITVAE